MPNVESVYYWTKNSTHVKLPKIIITLVIKILCLITHKTLEWTRKFTLWKYRLGGFQLGVNFKHAHDESYTPYRLVFTNGYVVDRIRLKMRLSTLNQHQKHYHFIDSITWLTGQYTTEYVTHLFLQCSATRTEIIAQLHYLCHKILVIFKT